MRHFISIAVLLVVFFWVDQGLVQHGFTDWISVAGASETRKLSKEESQAKAMAERRYNNFMETYHKIWSLFGSIHDDFTGTPGDPRFARLLSYWQSFETNKRHGYKMESDLTRFYFVAPKTPGGAFTKPRMHILTPAASSLNSEIGYNEITLLGFDSFKQRAQQVTTDAEAAKQAMEQACAANDRAKAVSMAQLSKEAATAAIKHYKIMRDSWPYTKKKRDEYRDLSEDLIFMENFAKEYRDTVQKVEKAKASLLKELRDYQGVFQYFNSKKTRFNDLQRTLNRHYNQFDVITKPYKDKPWAKSSLSNVQESLKRVNAISTSIPDSLYMDNLWYNTRRLPIAEAYSHFIGGKKNLDTFFSTVDKIQKLGQETKGTAEAALNSAKKAKACADNLPTLKPNSDGDRECPSSWNNCGNICCPPDVQCWNFGAIKQAVKAGRCR